MSERQHPKDDEPGRSEPLPPMAYTHRLGVGQRAVTSRGVEIEVERAAVEILGDHGRLLSMSKTWYEREHPGHTVYFNACIFSVDATEIWFGDLNLTLEADKLEELAARIGPIYVTPEQPYRFRGLVDVEDDERVVRFPRSEPTGSPGGAVDDGMRGG